jgi:hypothetical protein
MIKTGLVLLAGLLVAGQAMAADKPQCETNYKKEGSFFAGRRFMTWGEVSKPPEQAFKLIYQESVKSGLKVVNSDKDMGVLSLEQNVQLDGKQVSLPWNVLIEASGKGSKISVTKTTPSGYATGEDFQIRSMCSVISSGEGTGS